MLCLPFVSGELKNVRNAVLRGSRGRAVAIRSSDCQAQNVVASRAETLGAADALDYLAGPIAMRARRRVLAAGAGALGADVLAGAGRARRCFVSGIVTVSVDFWVGAFLFSVVISGSLLILLISTRSAHIGCSYSQYAGTRADMVQLKRPDPSSSQARHRS